MTLSEALKDSRQPYIKIPVWAVTALLPVFIALVGFTVKVSVHQAKTQTDLRNQMELTRDIRVDLADKVNRNEFNELRTYMLRIEDKLDRLIEKSL